jgi:hypothetical protein
LFCNSVSGNAVSFSICYLIQALLLNALLSTEQKVLRHDLLVPFKLLGMRSALLVPRTAGQSRIGRLPEAMFRMVGGMLI